MYQSYYSLLLLALKARIQQTVPEILLVEQDWRQIDNNDSTPALPWPCVLIDFTPSYFGAESKLGQWGGGYHSTTPGFPAGYGARYGEWAGYSRL